ncbi:MAG: hypothetical protein FWF12_00325 [Betaproteobacteria bacterium]|nr:hypothetical protein [Betaproteobacteria bacterium]
MNYQFTALCIYTIGALLVVLSIIENAPASGAAAFILCAIIAINISARACKHTGNNSQRLYKGNL